MKQVAIIEITRCGNDHAVYVDGQYVISADPGAGESITMVESVAQSLASIEGVEVTRLECDGFDEWQWDEVVAFLQLKGVLAGRRTQYCIIHEFTTAQGDFKKASLKFKATDFNDAVQQLVDFYDKNTHKLIRIISKDNTSTTTLYPLENDSFQLDPVVGQACWIKVGNLDVGIKQTDEGAVVDIFPCDSDNPDEITSTSALYSDALPETA